MNSYILQHSVITSPSILLLYLQGYPQRMIFQNYKIRSSSSWNIKSTVDSKSHSKYKKLLILGYLKTDKICSSSSWNIKSTVDQNLILSRYKKLLILGYFKTDKIRSSLSWNMKSMVDSKSYSILLVIVFIQVYLTALKNSKLKWKV